MNIFDIILIIILLMCIIDGFHRGFLKEIVKVVGIVLVMYISFIFMKPLGNILFEHLPMFQLNLIGIEITALNVFVYQIIAFFIIASILLIILRILLMITGILDKIVSLTVILKLPSKILGALVGFATGYISIFLILTLFSVPLSNLDVYHESKIKDKFTNNFLYTKDLKNFSKSVDEIYNLSKTIKDDDNRLKHTKKYNAEAFDIMLKNNIVEVDTVTSLVKENKIHDYKELNNVLNKYESRKD